MLFRNVESPLANSNDLLMLRAIAGWFRNSKPFCQHGFPGNSSTLADYLTAICPTQNPIPPTVWVDSLQAIHLTLTDSRKVPLTIH
jgi:hypothetical protein